MVKIRVNKSEAARRQIDVAIRLLFRGEDPIAIHTIAMAGFRILRDLAEARPDSRMVQMTKSVFIPGKEAEFWGAIQSFSNFLKHADRDADAISDSVDEKVNDITLVMAGFYYLDLGYKITPEMSTLVGWYNVLHPGLFIDDGKILHSNMDDHVVRDFRRMPRKEQLAFGEKLLSSVKSR